MSTIIVTTATSGIGDATIDLLASQGHKLILVARDQEKLSQKMELLQRTFPSGNFQSYCLDYTDESSINSFGAKLIQNNGEVSGLVLITPRPKLGANVLAETKEWIEMFSTTFIGPLNLLKQTLPLMKSSSKIAIVAGIGSVYLVPNHASSAVLRSAWVAEAKALSYQLGPQGIHVNLVSPGGVLTPSFVEKLNKRAQDQGVTPDEQLAKETANIPLRKYATPTEVAKCIEFLLSEAASHVSGVNLLCDGGFYLGH